MVFHLPLIVLLTTQGGSPLFTALKQSDQDALLRRAEEALDVACRIERFPAMRRIHATQPGDWQVQVFNDSAIHRGYRVYTGRDWVDFDSSAERIRWIYVDETRFPSEGDRIGASEATKLAREYYRKFGGSDEPRIESAQTLRSLQYPAGDSRERYSFDLKPYAGGLPFLDGGAHIELEPFGGRLVDLRINGVTPDLAVPATVLVTSGQVSASVAAAFRRFPGAPARFKIYAGDASSSVRIQVPRFPAALTELTPWHVGIAQANQAIPIWSVTVVDGSYFGQSIDDAVFWGATVDARTGRCLSLVGPFDPVRMRGDIRPSMGPAKLAAPFPANVDGVVDGEKVKPTRGTIKPAFGTPGAVLKRATVRVGKGFQTLFLDPRAGLVFVGGIAGKPDAALLKALKASVAAPTKPFGKG